MSNWGIKVMREGYGVTSTNPLEHVFSSSYGAVKIAQETLGTITLTGTANTTGTVTHNLGFAPMVISYSELSANKWFFGFPYSPSETMSINPDPSLTYAGTAKAYATFNQNAVGTVSLRYKLFIMGDSG